MYEIIQWITKLIFDTSICADRFYFNTWLFEFSIWRTVIDNLEKMFRVARAFYRYYLILILSVQCLYNDIIENDDIIRGVNVSNVNNSRVFWMIAIFERASTLRATDMILITIRDAYTRRNAIFITEVACRIQRAIFLLSSRFFPGAFRPVVLETNPSSVK